MNNVFNQYTYTVFEATTLWQGDIATDKSGWTLEEIKNAARPWDEKFTILMDAIQCGDLPLALPDKTRIKRTDLKEWMEKAYPSEKPAFLFEQEDSKGQVDCSKTEVVLGALLQYLKSHGHFKLESAKAEIAEFGLGRGFSSRSLDDVFAKAQTAFRSARKGANK